MKISGIYKITNTATGDCYIGSSKDVKDRWYQHKKPSIWKRCPNNKMYLDMQKYGINKFDFQILAEVEIEHLKEAEQQSIEKLKPIYNNNNAKGLDVDKRKEYQKEYMKEYYHKSDKHKEYQRKYSNKYYNQLCSYNGDILTLNALAKRFQRAGIKHYVLEAKKYLLEQNI